MNACAAKMDDKSTVRSDTLSSDQSVNQMCCLNCIVHDVYDSDLVSVTRSGEVSHRGREG